MADILLKKYAWISVVIFVLVVLTAAYASVDAQAKSKRINPRLKDVGIVSVIPRKAGPYSAGDKVSLEVRVRNNQGIHVNIAIGLKLDEPGSPIKVVTPKQLVKFGTVAVYEVTLSLAPDTIKNDRYKAQLILLDASKPGPKGHYPVWQDSNKNNNQHLLDLKIDSKGLYDVRADLVRIHISTVCHDDQSLLEKINVRATGYVLRRHVSVLSGTAKSAIVRASVPKRVQWPEQGWYHPVKPGQTVRPHLSVQFKRVLDTQFIYLNADVAIGKRRFSFFDRKTIPGQAIGVIDPARWKKGGTYHFIAANKKPQRKNSDCPIHGAYTVVWQIKVMPSKIKTK